MNIALAVIVGAGLVFGWITGVRTDLTSSRASGKPALVTPPHPHWNDGYFHYLVSLDKGLDTSPAELTQIQDAPGVNDISPVEPGVYSVTGTLSDSAVSHLPGVASVQQNHLLSLASTPPIVPPTNDPAFDSAYYLQNTGGSISGWPSIAAPRLTPQLRGPALWGRAF